MKSFFVDLHIHIGRTEKGQAVKISAANNLTFRNIAHESAVRKGMDVVGIIDCHSPSVQEEIMDNLSRGEMVELEGGGIRYRNTTILLGSEIEVRDPGMGPAHLLAYLPTLAAMQDFTGWMKRHMKNVELSSQRIYVTARNLQEEVIGRGGVMIPAHIFTPHKSVYGSATRHMAELLDLSQLAGVELGLSADSAMAGLIAELDPFTFVTNSDAHSLPKIGREYNKLKLEEPTFQEVVKALKREEGRAVEANYGLNPRLGKYHRTYCSVCHEVLEDETIVIDRCPQCGSPKMVRGVMDRILAIADRTEPFYPPYRPPYHFQVPMEYIPGLGPKKLTLLLDRFGTEMNVLHHAAPEALEEAVGADIAAYLLAARAGQLELEVGGGGKYGRVKNHS
ncbi:endonuclease Q family protein [Paenibacillus ferrarius]|uniref:endonuclease Q family protein n=1 Tax=Paenibacillus ferrarius TaxID=1469647 RepID=UPI003D28E330